MYKVNIEDKKLIPLKPVNFASLGIKERFDIQEWIDKTPQILGEDLLIIGKEVTLPSGKRLDLLCLDKSASLVVIELKRDDSGSAVEWQAIKYASSVSNFLPDEIYRVFAEYKAAELKEAKKSIEEFIDADIETLNSKQRIILVSKEFNSEVISAVLWLREFGLDIQCTRLAPYLDVDDELFIKPETIVPLPEARDYITKKEVKQRFNAVKPDWSGYWFVNVGEGLHRTWEDNMKFGYISAGQGQVYSRGLKRLSIGDKIFAYMKGLGYVGYGEIKSKSMMIRDCLTNEGTPLLDCDLKAKQPGNNSDDEQMSEYVVKVEWIKTFPSNDAKTFKGVFANQNVVCKLQHEATLEFVKKEFLA
ncbi:hypothetical protein N480_03750 [Pseudoalteromonas luteoviolacea S2607]|uniref:endonuclease NucS domain-containing protein n=1 Tax=Pseudoalteromonas luteoviolacea TaxID=43657 RepID=UPI0007B0A602|nr:endonuclease NucS domain-containing protein [Pseudoalteromonas luteoviolacea]KZN30069.1 hypothetical protein N480_03750 [Pseudoalteromonas luteoviolacea S2607]